MMVKHYGEFPFEECTSKLERLAAILGWSMAKVENGLCEMHRTRPPTDYFFPRQRIWTDESTCHNDDVAVVQQNDTLSDSDPSGGGPPSQGDCVALVIEEMPSEFKISNSKQPV